MALCAMQRQIPDVSKHNAVAVIDMNPYIKDNLFLWDILIYAHSSDEDGRGNGKIIETRWTTELPFRQNSLL